MKQEIDPRNIHVFRVNRATTTRKKESQTSTKRTTTTSLLNSTAESTTAASSRTSLSAETKRSICEDHIENPKLTQEALASKYGCKRTTVAKVSLDYFLFQSRIQLLTSRSSNLDYKVKRSLDIYR
jgi:hypothetical protein